MNCINKVYTKIKQWYKRKQIYPIVQSHREAENRELYQDFYDEMRIDPTVRCYNEPNHHTIMPVHWNDGDAFNY